MKALIVVDMQKDFIDGSLGTKEAQKIVDLVEKKIREYKKNKDLIIFTRDTHGADYMKTREGKHLPVVHCVKSTDGWQIPSALTEAAGKDAKIIDKPSFGYNGWAELLDEKTESVELIGLCTDICVVSNALIIKNLYPEMDVSVDAACCAGVTPDTHDAALCTMASCQIEIKNKGEEPWRKA